MSYQFSCSIVSNSLQSRGLQHARLPCPSPSPELAQTHVHQIGNTIQPSHSLLSPSPPAFNLSQHPGLSGESALSFRWPKYWNFSIRPSNEYSGPIFFRIDWFHLFAVQGTLNGLLQLQKLKKKKSSTSPVQKHQYFGAQPSLWSNSHIHT